MRSSPSRRTGKLGTGITAGSVRVPLDSYQYSAIDEPENMLSDALRHRLALNEQPTFDVDIDGVRSKVCPGNQRAASICDNGLGVQT